MGTHKRDIMQDTGAPTRGDVMRQPDGGNRPLRQLLRIQDRQLRALAGGIEHQHQQPAVVLGCSIGAWHKDGLLRRGQRGISTDAACRSLFILCLKGLQACPQYQKGVAARLACKC